MIPHFTPLFSAYSIIARDSQTGQFGVAVYSAFESLLRADDGRTIRRQSGGLG